jgi:hypothetical protein
MPVSFDDMHMLDASGPSYAAPPSGERETVTFLSGRQGAAVAPSRFASRKSSGASGGKGKAGAAREAFEEANPGLIASLREMASWHGFAASLVSQFDQRGSLSERQVATARDAVARSALRQAERARAKSSNSGNVDVSAIERLFVVALESGLKRPRFLTDVLVISPAPSTGRNAGSIYVKHDGEYAGRISGGRFMATAAASATTLPLLLELAADPSGVARMHGRRTGNCCCCGRELTDPESISSGIGPICADRWGL